jgi:hypothetical protein
MAINILKKIVSNLDKIGIVALICAAVFFWWKMTSSQMQQEEERISLQNRIAELSRVVDEGNGTWSRLAQERGDSLQRLNEMLPQLAETIRQRDEQIMALARATASLRPITIRVTEGSGANQQTETGQAGQDRIRVNFDATHQETVRVAGFTLTNPAEANVEVSLVRPVNFVVTTTQLPDRSWRTYINSDWEDLQIGNIESQVTPIMRSRRWEQDIEVSLVGAASVNGNSALLGMGVGYDFGAIGVSVIGGGITSNTGLDFAVGANIAIAPFDF